MRENIKTLRSDRPENSFDFKPIIGQNFYCGVVNLYFQNNAELQKSYLLWYRYVKLVMISHLYPG